METVWCGKEMIEVVGMTGEADWITEYLTEWGSVGGVGGDGGLEEGRDVRERIRFDE